MKPHVFAAAVVIALSPAAASADEPAQARQGQAREMRFHAMDQNNDGTITRNEWRGSNQSFRAHDWNGDGVLSGNEVRMGASREMTEDEDYDQTRRPDFHTWTDRGFRNLDHNGDGRIARTEWHYAREGFIRADRNRDGVLTRAEFLGEDTDLDREDRFEYLDANNNGRVERSEWHGSRDTFEWLDVNNDAALSRTEILGDETEQTDLSASLDINKDNLITPNEWHWSRRSFTRQDANGDGELSRRELTNAELSATSQAGTVGTSGRTIVVDSTERWVDTGLDVRSGDVIAVQATGTITLSGNGSDTAAPGGASRNATSAPLPSQPAGALIARIANGAPMVVGDRQTFTANGTGRLFFGVNDDHLPDNRGQFRVTVQRR